jgi:hypothetical protein
MLHEGNFFSFDVKISGFFYMINVIKMVMKINKEEDE